MNKPRIAIIGASYFQNPLILKAKEMGLETHVFAWQCGDVGERTADVFHPISITETEAILDVCRKLEISGICTIASDLANIAVAHVANALGLPGNTVECVAKSTNKALMRRCFEEHGDPSPRSIRVDASTDLSALRLDYPVIVKPTDRSGSRGITKLASSEGLPQALEYAYSESFGRAALIEEFACGREYSVEYISWAGEHRFLAITEKFTSGAPGFVETGHLQPARLDEPTVAAVRTVVEHALMSLGVECGPSHSELKIAPDGSIKIIEIGSRMGGDHIGSDLVQLSTGYDFLKATIQCALGIEPARPAGEYCAASGIRFVFSQEDLDVLENMKHAAPELLIYESPMQPFDHSITDSASRYGYFFFADANVSALEPYLPSHQSEDA